MKKIFYTGLMGCMLLAACNKTIDLYPESNLNTGTYFTNYAEYQAFLSGVYNGLQKPLFYEWQLTELRSDNSKQGIPGSTSSNNRDLSDLDMFIPSPAIQSNYSYWANSYNAIRNANILLQKLGVKYDKTTGTVSFETVTLPITEADRKQMAGEALFIRADQYFNLVRLYGGVFLVTESIAPEAAKGLRRASVAETYKLIEADLKAAAQSMANLKYQQIKPADLGRATTWAAKALLGKVYLTQNKKSDAIAVLDDVRLNSGHSLLTGTNAYTNIFSINNEMNAEIIFAVRYKAPGLGIGSPFANLFAPLNSGQAVVLGDGDGLNYPTSEFDTATMADARRPLLLGQYGTGTNIKLYTKKFLSTLTVQDDAENDWPVIRFADVLLMLAEAQGFSPVSIGYINQVRQRGGNGAVDPATITTVAAFEQLLSTERRIELAFENQRWFDLVRFNTTLTTVTAEQTMKAHFANEYFTHYRQYTAPIVPLATLQGYVTPQKLLLPIPQREFDTNPALPITEQNPGY